MNRFLIIEKMFEMLGTTVDGKEIWEIIEKDINANGKNNGYYNIELGKFGDDSQLYFAGVDIKTNYDEENYTYTTDINLLSIQNEEKTIYIEDVKI